MDWQEDDLVLISALSHYAYCPRRCFLIYVENQFEDNIYTVKGQLLHERVDQVQSRMEDGIGVERALPLWSGRLGLVGKGDVVEFHDRVPYPVEYKHGALRDSLDADIQLCAQAICLEEMFAIAVPRGAIYHYQSRTRREVIFSDLLRNKVEEFTLEIRRMLKEQHTIPPLNNKKCVKCSLNTICIPQSERAAKTSDFLFKSTKEGGDWI